MMYGRTTGDQQKLYGSLCDQCSVCEEQQVTRLLLGNAMRGTRDHVMQGTTARRLVRLGMQDLALPEVTRKLWTSELADLARYGARSPNELVRRLRRLGMARHATALDDCSAAGLLAYSVLIVRLHAGCKHGTAAVRPLLP